MKLTTTRLAHKPFAWSYSKLKNFETCPRRHYEIDIAKNVREEESEQLKWGNQVHAGLAKHLTENAPLPAGLEAWEDFCKRLVTSPGNLMVEQKLAITKDFGPTDWFGKDAWFRGIADVLKVNGPVALALDWKTGRVLEDSQQLALMAACVFAHYPEVVKIRTEFVWLKEDATSRADFARSDMRRIWQALWPRIEALEHAYNTSTYPPKPSPLCKRWCPVTSCPHHGG